MADLTNQIFKSGVHNLLDAEVIPQDAISDEKNWITQDGSLKLVNGKVVVGATGVSGKIYGEIFGYKIDGTKVHWRKVNTKIQYLNGTTWTDTVTGLTAASDYTFANYSSLAGTFTFAFGIDGIYKMHNAVPGSFNSMYDSTKNFKGYALIDKGRTILWNRPEDKTGVYGSWIDTQKEVSGATGVYTTVTAEATASLTGTLAFKAGGATRNCFGLVVTHTVSGEVFTDNYLGVLTGSLGNAGTINYITGAYTFNVAGIGTVDYRWENSNLRGLTDFSKSATRLAGEGFVLSQDEGGDAIKTIQIGQDGAYYSLKETSAYSLELDAADTNPINLVYRKNIGVPTFRASVSTNKGIVFLNTANPAKPTLTVLQRNPLGDNIEPVSLFPQFKFSNYNYSDCSLATYERYVMVMCRTIDGTANDTILMCDMEQGSVDITSFNARTSVIDSGVLYIGSSISESIYKLFDGFDDDGQSISNFIETKAETYKSDNLKKVRKLRFSGLISPDQNYSVYISTDNSTFQLVGTVRGDRDYVDYTSSQAIGTNTIGGAVIGGDAVATVYPYLMEMTIKTPKFRKRMFKIVANAIGYVSIDNIIDRDILVFENRLPMTYRLKQNVSLDGTQTDLSNPQF